MKKFKNFFKKNLKFIIILIVAIIITSMVSVYAAYSYLSTDVSYTKADGTTVSVADALNELYKNKTSSSATTANVTTEMDYTGYYADIDTDGTPDGVIFADIALTCSGTWSSTNSSTFSYSGVTSGLKSYYISGVYYGDYGKNFVISPVSGTSGTDRFYIMSLTDFDNGVHSWYYSANGKMSDYASYTSTAFGKGKENTTKMITKWNASGYGTHDSSDVWKLIQTKVNAGWFVPSKDEWSAFGKTLGITKYNHSTYNLKDDYWSSSQYNTGCAWRANFSDGSVGYGGVDSTRYVRLAATF